MHETALESKPNFTAKLKLPEAYPVSGYYPTAYQCCV